jgi:hypothetical protein
MTPGALGISAAWLQAPDPTELGSAAPRYVSSPTARRIVTESE